MQDIEELITAIEIVDIVVNRETKNLDVYVYFFEIRGAKVKLTGIEIFKKGGKTGNTYKKEELFHHEYTKTFCHKTNTIIAPPLPDYIFEKAKQYCKGFLSEKIKTF